MSRRARSARHLSSILTEESGTWTVVRYFRQGHRYGVCWTGGPSAAEMYQLAARHTDEIPQLNVNDVAWLRTEPSAPADQ
jgi:hypothetical protein